MLAIILGSFMWFISMSHGVIRLRRQALAQSPGTLVRFWLKENLLDSWVMTTNLKQITLREVFRELEKVRPTLVSAPLNSAQGELLNLSSETRRFNLAISIRMESCAEPPVSESPTGAPTDKTPLPLTIDSSGTG